MNETNESLRSPNASAHPPRAGSASQGPGRGTTRRRLGLVAVLTAASLAAAGLLRVAGATSVGSAAGGAGADLARIFHAPGGGPVSFRGELDRTRVLAPGDGLVRLELVMAAEKRPAGARMPTDLVVILDRSGSMEGTKLAHARAAIRSLVAQLAPEDRFALVTYSEDAHRDIALEAASAAARAGWLGVVDGIPALGGTNLASGLDVGLATVESSRIAGRAPRVILISDGLANQGDISHAGLRARAARAAAGEYALSTVGVGVDFDGELMATLADAGTGNFHYLENAVDLAEVFAAEFATARETVASGLEVEVSPARGVALVEAAGYPLEPGAEGGVVFRPGSLFAGQERRVWVTLRVDGDGPGLQELGRFALRYREGGEPRHLALAGSPGVARVQDESAFYAGFDREAWERAVVVDRLNAVRREVANQVAAGRPEAALEELRSYQAELAPQAARLRSQKADEALSELDGLASQVKDHAEGKHELAPAAVQHLRALGYVEGRAGSRK